MPAGVVPRFRDLELQATSNPELGQAQVPTGETKQGPRAERGGAEHRGQHETARRQQALRGSARDAV